MATNILTIAETALERTRERKLAWSPTVSEHIYLSVVGDQSLAIEEIPHVGYVLKVLNRNGTEIARFDSAQEEPAAEIFIRWKVLEELYQEARGQALGADKELEKLYQALKSR
jgi:hypothetical protein